jgi:hypothetical protein
MQLSTRVVPIKKETVLEIRLIAGFLEETTLVLAIQDIHVLNRVPYSPDNTARCRHLVGSCPEPIL